MILISSVTGSDDKYRFVSWEADVTVLDDCIDNMAVFMQHSGEVESQYPVSVVRWWESSEALSQQFAERLLYSREPWWCDYAHEEIQGGTYFGGPYREGGYAKMSQMRFRLFLAVYENLTWYESAPFPYSALLLPADPFNGIDSACHQRMKVLL